MVQLVCDKLPRWDQYKLFVQQYVVFQVIRSTSFEQITYACPIEVIITMMMGNPSSIYDGNVSPISSFAVSCIVVILCARDNKNRLSEVNNDEPITNLSIRCKRRFEGVLQSLPTKMKKQSQIVARSLMQGWLFIYMLVYLYLFCS